MPYLKEKTVRIESIGDSLLVRELPALAQIQIIEVQDKPFEGLFIACKFGVVDWLEKSVDEIKNLVTLAQASEIAGLVFDMSGLDTAKN